MRRLIALVGLLLASTACGGNREPTTGMRVKLFDLSIYGDNRRGTDRLFRGTCGPGRLTVDFRPGDEMTIANRGRLVASISAKQAFIGCPDAHVENPTHDSPGWLFRRFARVNGPATLVCVPGERIEISVHPSYRFEDTFVGGGMIVSTAPHGGAARHALISAVFKEGGESWLMYHTPRCRVGG
jgi:hypothetical protein